jgi:XTP/dITP diphosphohydrolase
MSRELIFATHNENKVKEVKALLPEGYTVISLSELNGNEQIPETGDTLEHNALEKAYAIYLKYGKDCFAEDTGLEVDVLDGAPGVYSARYAGEDSNADANIELLLENLRGETNRSARFKTVFALIIDGKKWLFDGQVEGHILEHRQGNSGFGYDPIFMPLGFDKSFAEMASEVKSAISHRGIALRRMIAFLELEREEKIISFEDGP